MQKDWTVQTLLKDMSARGDHEAVTTFRDGRCRTASYGVIAHDALSLACGLRNAGAKAGEYALLLGPNSADWVIVRLALAAAGLITLPLDDLAPPAEIDRLADTMSVGWSFCAPTHLEAVRRVTPPGRVFSLKDNECGEMAGWRSLLISPAALPQVDPSAPTVLLQTSGTTGPPKFFELSHRHIWANVGALATEGLVGSDDRLVLPLPLHHVYPQVVGLLTPLTTGATIVFPETVTGPALLEAIRSTQASGIIGVPRLYEALAFGLEQTVARRGYLFGSLYRLSLAFSTAASRRFGVHIGRILFAPLRRRLSPKLNLLISGGARLDVTLTWKLAGLGFDVRSGYGLAETASTITGNLPGRERLGSEGRPFQGGEVRIDEPDKDGAGEILLRGPNVFECYVDPVITQAAFTPDGWFRTGDVGHLDDDGFLYVTGRIKETIVLGGGKKVSPEEMESAYGQSPFIAEIAVLEQAGGLVGLVRPDEAAIARAGHHRPDDVIRVALSDAGGALASYQRLAGFALTRHSLPRTRLGKYKRFLLPQLYALAQRGQGAPSPALAAADYTLLDEPRAAAIWRLLDEHFGERLRGLDDHLAIDLGIDSLAWITLSLAIQQATDVDFSGADLARLTTVRDLIDAVQQAPAGSAIHSTGAANPWMAQVSPLARALATMLYSINRWLMRLVFRLNVTGNDNLPAHGPFIVACNHLSDLDPLVVAAALPPDMRRQTRWGAAATRLIAATTLRPLYVALGLFPLSDTQPAVGLACARATLDRGDVLVWFPESWRSPDGNLQDFRPGVGHLVIGTDIPIVPACIKGTFEALPRTRRWPRPTRVSVRFGRPVSPADLVVDEKTANEPSLIAQALKSVVGQLCREM